MIILRKKNFDFEVLSSHLCIVSVPIVDILSNPVLKNSH